MPLPPLPGPGYDFGGAQFDLKDPADSETIRFILSQALYGEATGVYCGKSLYAAESMEAAQFYLRQAKQELAHLELFAEIFRILEMQPMKPHWVIKALSSHNNYYPLKVMMEHAIGEGMVLDIFKDVLLQTLPDNDPRVPLIKKKLEIVCREEIEHVQWGEKETKRLLGIKPWLKKPYLGLLLVQMAMVPLIIRMFRKRTAGHPVMSQLGGFLSYVRDRAFAQGRELGFVDAKLPGFFGRMWAMTVGVLFFVRSKFSRSKPLLERNYLKELGFKPDGAPPETAAKAPN
jgi:hypothetical protein